MAENNTISLSPLGGVSLSPSLSLKARGCSNMEGWVGGRSSLSVGRVVVVDELLEVGELLVEILEGVPGLLVGGVPLVLLILCNNLPLDPLQIQQQSITNCQKFS